MQRTHVQRSTATLPLVAATGVARDRTDSSWPRRLATTSRAHAASSAATEPNTAIEWNEIASTAILVTAAQPPHAGVLSLAMVQGAVYDAVNAIDGGHEPYLVEPAAKSGDSKEAAAATAAYRVLVGFPNRTPAVIGLVPTQLAACSRSSRRRSRPSRTDPRSPAGERRQGCRSRDAHLEAG